MARWGLPLSADERRLARLAADAAGEPRCWAEGVARLVELIGAALARAAEETERG